MRPFSLRRSEPARLVAALALAGSVAAQPLAAQYRAAPPPAAWALEGVTVLGADGVRAEGQNLVVRDGLVEALGPGVEIPADARLLDGEGLTVMPGLVDAQGHAEVEWPDNPDADDVTSWDPPRWRQGFFPHRRIALHLTDAGPELEGRRRDGVVASLVHPVGGMAPGQPAVLVHRVDADLPWELVDRESAGLTLSFQTARGVYPSQLFGVIAFLRQAFLDAERYEELRATYRADPSGLVPPAWDPDFEALRRAARGDVPVFFQADGDEDIRRVLELADGFGFRPVIVGGDEAWKLADELRERNVTVLVSVDFPRPDEWDPEADTVPGELEPAAVREKDRLEAIWSNAGRLEEAGVSFVLTSGGGTGDLLEGARRAVEYGLSPDGALRALTAGPAALLELPGLAGVAPGRPATFVVTDGDPLEEGTGVAYTFVEGGLTRGPAAPGAEEEERDEPAGDLSGDWEGEMGSPQGGERGFTLTLEQSPEGDLTGSIAGSGMPSAPVSGFISDRAVTLRIEVEGLPEPIVLAGTLAEDGDRLEGEGSTPMGEIRFTARRGPGGGSGDGAGRQP